MENKDECPFCKRKFSDILKHFLFTHDIEDMEKLNKQLEKLRVTTNRQKEFGKYVENLQEQKKKNLLSSDDYRRLITEWTKKHK